MEAISYCCFSLRPAILTAVRFSHFDPFWLWGPLGSWGEGWGSLGKLWGSLGRLGESFGEARWPKMEPR